MAERLPALMIDLDGTILDPKPGILGCLNKVLLTLGVNANGPLDRSIGPPVEEWAIELLPDGSDSDRSALVRNYRTCYDFEGWKNTSVYAGVRELLKQLHDAGFPMYVCTSKRLHFALRILDACD